MKKIVLVTSLSSGALCECGCGNGAPVVQRNNSRMGHIKGSPLRFISGHNRRVLSGSLDGKYRAEDNGYITPCWIWTGAINRKGYGRIQVRGIHRQAHREVYEQSIGGIPEGNPLDHLCRVRSCVNPEHMEPVTTAENNRRSSPLTQDKVLEIRKSVATQSVIAAHYGVSRQCVSDIRRGVRWA